MDIERGFAKKDQLNQQRSQQVQNPRQMRQQRRQGLNALYNE